MLSKNKMIEWTDLTPISFYFLLIFPASSEPALKRTFFFALIFSTAPVCGFLPVRALVCCTSQVPKPTKVILSPLANVSSTVAVNASKKRFVSACQLPDFSAMALINSDLFMVLYLILSILAPIYQTHLIKSKYHIGND